MGNAAQRAETPHTCREVVDGHLVGDVERDGHARRAAVRERCGLLGDGGLVHVGDDQHVDGAHQPLRARRADTAPCTSDERDGGHRASVSRKPCRADVVILRTGRTAGVRCARGTRSSLRGFARVRIRPRRHDRRCGRGGRRGAAADEGSARCRRRRERHELPGRNDRDDRDPLPGRGRRGPAVRSRRSRVWSSCPRPSRPSWSRSASRSTPIRARTRSTCSASAPATPSSTARRRSRSRSRCSP